VSQVEFARLVDSGKAEFAIVAHPAEIRHPTFGILRLDHDGGSYVNYLGEVWLTSERRVRVQIELDTDKMSLGDGLEAAWEGFERFRQREAEGRLRTAELLLPDIHHFFSESYTTRQVAEKLSLVEVFLDELGCGTAGYDSGGEFKKGAIAAHFREDGSVKEVAYPN
jgi:hypothetical protein